MEENQRGQLHLRNQKSQCQVHEKPLDHQGRRRFEIAEEFVANYEDIELAKINYANHKGGNENPVLRILDESQKASRPIAGWVAHRD